MPFTLAHPAAVLPLRRIGLPLAAMVAGSMSPDLPLFVHGIVTYGFTHSAAGVVTADPALALLGLAAWWWLLRDACVDMAPAAVRERLPASAGFSSREWALAVPAAMVGAATHVAWDSFTHAGRWGVERLSWLQHTHGWFAGYQWGQYGSGLLGLSVLAAFTWTSMSRLPRRPRTRRVPSMGTTVVLGAGAVILAAAGASALSQAASGLHAMAYRGAVSGTLALAAGVCGLAVAWRLLARWHPGSVE